MNLLDPNVVRVEPKEFPTADTYRGHSDMRRHLVQGRNTWEEGTCEPIEFFPIGNKIVVIIHIKVRLKNNLTWLDAQIADGFSLKEGLVTEFHSFVNKEKAL